jgi:hypothetical protein
MVEIRKRNRVWASLTANTVSPSRNVGYMSEAKYAARFGSGTTRRAPMKFRRIAAVIVVILIAVGLASAKDSSEKKKEKTRKMETQTLKDLYKRGPTAEVAIQKSAGYAVFNNMGTNLFLLSTARGAGVAVNSKAKQETFMKMISAGAGLGLGVKDYRVIFVFENNSALSQFLDSGCSGSAQTDAAAKVGEKGGAYSGSSRGCPGRLGVSDHQEWCRTAIDAPGNEVLQGRRSQQIIALRKL